MGAIDAHAFLQRIRISQTVDNEQVIQNVSTVKTGVVPVRNENANRAQALSSYLTLTCIKIV